MGQILDISDALLHAGISASPTEVERAIAGEAIRRAEGAVKRYLRYDPVWKSHTEYYPQYNVSQSARIGVWEADANQAYWRSLSEAATNELQLQHIPIRSITSLRIDYDARSGTRDDSFAADTEKTEGTDFWANYDEVDSDGNRVCRDGILRSEGRWPAYPNSVKVVYVAGFTDAELRGNDTVIDASPIFEAVLDETIRRVIKAFQRMKRTKQGWIGGPLASENLGDYSYTVDTAVLSKLVVGGDILPETKEKLTSFEHMGFEL